MNYNWEKYKDFARFVLSNQDQSVDEETKIRNAISRLFYHAFHCLENWAIKSLRYEATEINTHGSLKSHLIRCGHSPKAKLYAELKRIRGICDYDHKSDVDLKILLKMAEDFHARLAGPLEKYSSFE